jgi:hypothetical protein
MNNINYNEIAKTDGIEESRRLWKLNNASELKRVEVGNLLLCPCCEMHHFKNKDFYEFCPICDWQDDPVQRRDAAYIGGANKLSLNEFKIQWSDKQLLQEISQAEISCSTPIPPELINVLEKIKSRLSPNKVEEAAN